MYITFVAGSPCAQTISFARNLLTSLPTPAESRNNSCRTRSFWSQASCATDGASLACAEAWDSAWSELAWNPVTVQYWQLRLRWDNGDVCRMSIGGAGKAG